MQILLVEDDLSLGRALHEALRQAGHRCTWVRGLEDGWVHLEAEVHAALLLDIQLPDGEGFALLDRLRRRGIATPVLVITARDTLEDCLRGLHGGADDYLVKPFAVSELLARLLAVLRRSASHATNVWEAGPLRLNVEARQAQMDGQDLPLTQREFDTVLELMRQPGKVVQRAVLIRRVWGPQSDLTDNALDVHMHGLRRKIDPVRVHTVRGVGYALQLP